MSSFTLDNNQIEEYLVQIITGKKIFVFNNVVYAVCFPDIQIRDKARLIYMKALKKFEAMGVPSKNDMRLRIKKYNLLPSNYYQNIKSVESEISALNEARELTTSKTQKNDLKFQIESLQMKLFKLSMQEYNFMVHTVESKAEEVKIEHMVSRCTFCGEELDEKYWNTYKDFQNSTETKFIISAKSNFLTLTHGLPPHIIRALARNDSWRRRWKASKQTGSEIFKGTSSDWDINKVEICYWSDFYDSIFSYHTPPPEHIIDDDDALFDWIKDVNRINKSGGQIESSQEGTIVNKVGTPYKVRPKGKKNEQ